MFPIFGNPGNILQICSKRNQNFAASGKSLLYDEIYNSRSLKRPWAVSPNVCKSWGWGLVTTKTSRAFPKNNLNLEKQHFTTHQLQVKYAAGKQISAQ